MIALSANLAVAQQGGTVAGDSIRVALEFDAPEGCSDRASFESGLRARFARIHIVEQASSVWSLRVRLSTSTNGIHGELRLTDAQGQSDLRAVDGLDCPHVVAALSLTAALAIEQTVSASLLSPDGSDGPAATGNGPSPRDAAATTASAPQLEPTPKSSSKDVVAAEKTPPKNGEPETPSTKRPYRVALGLFATNLVSPQTSFGTQARVGYVFDWGGLLGPEVGLGLSYVPNETMQLHHGLRVGYEAVAASVCPLRLRVGQWVALSPCLSAERGRLRVIDHETMVGLWSRRWQTTLGVAGRAEVALGSRAALELAAGLELPVARRTYITLEPVERVGETPVVSFRFGLGGRLAF